MTWFSAKNFLFAKNPHKHLQTIKRHERTKSVDPTSRMAIMKASFISVTSKLAIKMNRN